MTAIHIGDVVQWHPEAGFNCEWTVTQAGPKMLTIEADLVEGDTIRVVRRSAQRKDCRLIGQQLSLIEETA